MKRTAMLLSSALLLGLPSKGGAQSAPAQPPQLRDPVTQAAPAAAPITLSGVQAATFGSPRTSNDGSQTRVVFDLMPGVTYTLTPTFTGLRLDVQGARVQPAVNARFGNSIVEYRAGGGQVTLVTAFPLSLTEGWTASEATLASGSRVLILDIGPTLSGGADEALKDRVRALAALLPSAPQMATPAQDSLPPGDPVTPAAGAPAPAPAAKAAPPPAPALPSATSATPSPLLGRVPGTPPAALATLTPPRIGKNPGQTRVVFDLPPGTAYRIVPGGVGLRLELLGVGAAAQVAQNVSPELRSWRYDKAAGGVTVTLVTGTPTTDRSGWRAQLLPPASGSTLSRLTLDLSPALANLAPLSDAERVIGSVPPVTTTTGLAILAFTANTAKPRVVIDPGHGGKDPGAKGTVTEKDVTLDVALRVRDLLSEAGVDAVLTRDTDRELNPSKTTDLEMRAALGTPGTQLFVSIHVNAIDARNTLRGYGIETWWNPNHELSSSLAGVLQKHLIDVTGAFNQGLKSSRSLSVLRNSRIPAALVEIGYTSHPVDGLNLKDTNYLDRVAVGIAQGISEALITGITATAAIGGAGK